MTVHCCPGNCGQTYCMMVCCFPGNCGQACCMMVFVAQVTVVKHAV